jgi:hypothetical protein
MHISFLQLLNARDGGVKYLDLDFDPRTNEYAFLLANKVVVRQQASNAFLTILVDSLLLLMLEVVVTVVAVVGSRAFNHSVQHDSYLQQTSSLPIGKGALLAKPGTQASQGAMCSGVALRQSEPAFDESSIRHTSRRLRNYPANSRSQACTSIAKDLWIS